MNALSQTKVSTLEMKLSVKYLAACMMMFAASNVVGEDVKVLSPDKKIELSFRLDAANNNQAVYSVSYSGKELLLNSPLGFEFENDKTFQSNLAIKSVRKSTVNKSWKPVYGERNTYPDHYNNIEIVLQESTTPYRKCVITFRVYDEGVAFRYKFLTATPVTITKELTGFHFAQDYPSWVATFAQAQYTHASISKTGKGCERPYVIEAGKNIFMALGEAALVNNARMKFDRSPDDSLLVLAALDGKVNYSSTFNTPWRYVMLSSSAGKLLENNYLILNLNEPNALKEVSWIKPGKVIREVTLTTKGALECIDFAEKRHLQYIEFDAGWYGAETNPASDATTVTLDPARSKGPLDLEQVIAYGKSKGIGVILYVNQRALTNQLDTLLPLYQSWGVKGVKYGFVNVGSQPATTWLHEAVRNAAKYKLMIDIHDEYRPTGYSRTYPNLLTQEGVRGNEEMPDGNTNTTLPFTRFVAGAADATVSYFHRPELKPVVAARPNVRMLENTCCHQLALSVIDYSPLQFLYWYDSPEDARNEPELTFFDQVPTVWDDTKVLQGEIGKNILIARRKGADWFVGGITNNDARKVKCAFDFLQPGKEYELTLFTDGGDKIPTRTHVKMEKKKVTSHSSLELELKARGGFTMIIKPL